MCFAGGQIKSTPSIAWRTLCFNPRPPYGGRRREPCRPLRQRQFQSTSSVWRTTAPRCKFPARRPNFNPRPPCGGRPAIGWTHGTAAKFQSTSSVWRTTSLLILLLSRTSISIHVLRVEDDFGRQWLLLLGRDFNPRPPCGGRRFIRVIQVNQVPFQSTSSVWRTTPALSGMIRTREFQSTSSVWRTTFREQFKYAVMCNFNPRPPCGGRPGSHKDLTSHS